MEARILYAEDDAIISSHVLKSLQEVGFHVDHTPSGPDAWELGNEGSHAAIILDLGLPGLDGMTMLKRWRKDGIRLRS